MVNDDDSVSFDAAITALRAWHYSAVRDLVDDCIREMRDANPADRDGWIADWLHESIDGHNHVIYTIKAKAILLASDNEDAYEDEIGDGTADVSARAYMAFRADAMELLDARRDEWEEEEEEEDRSDAPGDRSE